MAVQCALWYVLPLSYVWAVAPEHFLPTVNEAIDANLGVALTCLAIFIVSLSISPVHRLVQFTTIDARSALSLAFCHRPSSPYSWSPASGLQGH